MDPLSLSAFSDHILSSVGPMALAAAVGLACILLVWGWLRS